MTIDEAIKILSKVTLAYEIGKVTITQREINEALDMAIQALENHMDYDKGFKDGIKYAMEHTELE